MASTRNRFPPTKFWVSSILLGLFAIGLGYTARNWSESQGFLPDSGMTSRRAPLRDAPDFRLPDDQGRMHRLSEFRGKVVVLHFWATWCPPCLDEIPHWVELARKMEGKPVAWVAISLDKTWEEAHRYLKPGKLPPNLISVLDAKNETPDAWGSYNFPETYLITPDQKILSKWVGPQPWESQRMQDAIQRVVELTIKPEKTAGP